MTTRRYHVVGGRYTRWQVEDSTGALAYRNDSKLRCDVIAEFLSNPLTPQHEAIQHWIAANGGSE